VKDLESYRDVVRESKQLLKKSMDNIAEVSLRLEVYSKHHEGNSAKLMGKISRSLHYVLERIFRLFERVSKDL